MVTGLLHIGATSAAPTMQSHTSVSTSPRRTSQARSTSPPASSSGRAHQQIPRVCWRTLPDVQRRHPGYAFPSTQRTSADVQLAQKWADVQLLELATCKRGAIKGLRPSLVCTVCFCGVRSIKRPFRRLQANHRPLASLCHADLRNLSARHCTSAQPF